MMTRASVAFCIMTAFAVFAASASAKKAKADADADKAKADTDKAKADADKANADADKANDDKIAELNTEIDFLHSYNKMILDKHIDTILEFNQRTTEMYNNHNVKIVGLRTELAQAKIQHQTELDKLVDAINKLKTTYQAAQVLDYISAA